MNFRNPNNNFLRSLLYYVCLTNDSQRLSNLPKVYQVEDSTQAFWLCRLHLKSIRYSLCMEKKKKLNTVNNSPRSLVLFFFFITKLDNMDHVSGLWQLSFPA